MLMASRMPQVFAYPAPVDLRKGYNGLVGLVTSGLGQRVFDGSLYLFVNRHRTSCKVLLWDGTGLCIYGKRLARGRFACLWRDGVTSVSLSRSELQLFIEGCTLVGTRALSPAEIVYKTHAA